MDLKKEKCVLLYDIRPENTADNTRSVFYVANAYKCVTLLL